MIDPAFPNQRRNVIALASLYTFRMLGLFMVLPVLVLYADSYQHSSPFLLGAALGAYGLSQALLQIPFGMWSDRWGRTPVIAVGLLLFAGGSVVAALAESVYGLIVGRFLQGAGAIGSVLMAMVGDLTSDESRTKTMAGIGASIGVSFSLALVVGPLVSSLGGPAAIFWLTAGFAGVGLLILLVILPPLGRRSSVAVSTNNSLIGTVLRSGELLRLDWGIFSLHFVLMANFVVLPLLLRDVAGLPGERHWQVYLPLLAGAFVLMLPFMLWAERKRRVKAVFLGAVALLGSMQLLLSWIYAQPALLVACLFLFFVAFNLLEANLPSLVSKAVTGNMRGTANGVYSTSQFAGISLGGLLGGVALTWGGPRAVFGLCALVAAIWWLVALFMASPRQFASVLVPVNGNRQRTLERLLQVPGVTEVDWLESRRSARLRVDKAVFRQESIADMGLADMGLNKQVPQQST